MYAKHFFLYIHNFLLFIFYPGWFFFGYRIMAYTKVQLSKRIFYILGKFRKEFRRAFDCCSSAENHHGYEMNSVCCKNTTRDTGLGSNYSRSFRRSDTCKRTWVQGKNFDERRSTRSSLIRMDL